MNGPLVMAARAYLGVKFRHRGRSRFALDCAGLAWCAYRDCGLVMEDQRTYGPEPFRDGLVESLNGLLGEPVTLAPVTAGTLQDGDVVLMRFHQLPHHIAIVAAAMYAGEPAFNLIHADGEVGRVVEHRLTEDMVARITHVYRKPV